jgi:hypothetical protein
VSSSVDLVNDLRFQHGKGAFSHQGAAGSPLFEPHLGELSMSLPDLKPKGPKKVMGADSSSTDAANTLLFDMYSWVRFLLLIITATLAGSEVT